MDRPDLNQIEPDFDVLPEPIVIPPPSLEGDELVDSDIELLPEIEPISPIVPIPELDSNDEGWVDDTGNVQPQAQPAGPLDLRVRYSAHIGKVLKTYYASSQPELGDSRGIDVELSDVVYGASPTLSGKPTVEAKNMSNVVAALPWPLREDQAKYHVKAGECVTVFFDDWGDAWFMVDELPFVGTVVSDGTTTAANFWGSGNTTLKIKRSLLQTDPDTAQATLATGTVTYNYVVPMLQGGQHHGYQVGDAVLCFRRGRYVFALPGKSAFHGKVVAAGPSAEADFTDERYWVELRIPTVTYSTNAWDWNGADTTTVIVCAANLAERAGGTHNLTAGSEVVVTLMGDGAVRPYWAFSLAAATPAEWAVTYEHWTYSSNANGCYVMCHPCDDEAGTNPVAGTNIKVWLPRGSREEDPNIEDGAVLAVAQEPNGDYVALDAHLDGKVYRSIRAWYGLTAPSGWHKMDGGYLDESFNFPQAGGRVLVGQRTPEEGETTTALGEEDDYVDIGNYGGNAWHGLNEWDDEFGVAQIANTHQDHQPHVHTIERGTTYNLAETGSLTLDAPSNGTTSYEKDGSTASPGNEMTLKHGGHVHSTVLAAPHNSPATESPTYADTDNRMPYLTVCWIMRYDNSEDTNVALPDDVNPWK